MHNDSVKFKKNVPKSQASSLINDFSLEQSPIPNLQNYQNFTHAQNISARLSKTSHLNDINIRVSTPNCSMSVKQFHILRDEVLSKSPINQCFTPIAIQNTQANNNKGAVRQTNFTQKTMNRIKQIENFISNEFHNIHDSKAMENEKTYGSSQSDNSNASSDETEDEELYNTQFKKNLNQKLDELRILRNDPVYFETYDGEYALNHPQQQNFQSNKGTTSGVTINNGRYIQSVILDGDTFRVNRICDNPTKSNFTAICPTDSYLNEAILCGTESNQILCWNQIKQINYTHYSLAQDQGSTFQYQPTYIKQHLDNIYIGTSNNFVNILDHRMKFNDSRFFTIQQQDRMQNNNIPDQCDQYIMESPKSNKNSNFPKLELESIQQEDYDYNNIIQPLNFCNQAQDGIRYIDVMDNSLLITFQNGFCCYDIRNSKIPLLKYSHCSLDPIKVMFSQFSSNHVICGDRNSQFLKIWNIDQNDIVYELDLQQNPIDIISSKETNEILTLNEFENTSMIQIYGNTWKQFELVDTLIIDNFPMTNLLLDKNCENLFGMGLYSLRLWKFYDFKEISRLQQQIFKLYKSRMNRK